MKKERPLFVPIAHRPGIGEAIKALGARWAGQCWMVPLPNAEAAEKL